MSLMVTLLTILMLFLRVKKVECILDDACDIWYDYM